MGIPFDRETHSTISVIVPIFNVERYLSQCIESLLNQSYSNVEIILIDDGSSDDSSAICNKFVESYPTIKVLHTKNQGVSAARNLGVTIATGNWIAFVDSDDWINPDALQLMYDTAIHHKADIVITGYSIATKEGEIEYRLIDSAEAVFEHQERNLLKASILHPEVAGNKLSSHAHTRGGVWGKLFSRELIMKNGLTFMNLTLCEDLIFVLSVVEKANRTVFLSTSTYHYRARITSAVNRYTEDAEARLSDILNALQSVTETEEENDGLLANAVYCETVRLIFRVFSQYYSHPDNPKGPFRLKKGFRNFSSHELLVRTASSKIVKYLNARQRLVYLLFKNHQFDILFMLFRFNHTRNALAAYKSYFA